MPQANIESSAQFSRFIQLKYANFLLTSGSHFEKFGPLEKSALFPQDSRKKIWKYGQQVGGRENLGKVLRITGVLSG